MKERILVVSSANMDFVQRLRRLPLSGETLIEQTGTYSWFPGGKGANSAVAMARLGVDCVFCCRLGCDSNGKRLLALYEREGIDTRFIVKDPDHQTGLASIFVEEDGKNRILVYPGANLALCSEDVEDAFTCLPDAVYFQMEIPEVAALSAAEHAHRKNIPLIVDAGAVREDFPLEELGRVEIFSPNENETFVITGIRPSNADSCLRAAIRLKTRVDAKYILIKLGKLGSFLYDGKYYHMIPAKTVSVVDTTAAGDVFTAAVAARYLRGDSLLDAVRYATYAGAICVSREGAYPSIPRESDIEEMIRKEEED